MAFYLDSKNKVFFTVDSSKSFEYSNLKGINQHPSKKTHTYYIFLVKQLDFFSGVSVDCKSGKQQKKFRAPKFLKSFFDQSTMCQ